MKRTRAGRRTTPPAAAQGDTDRHDASRPVAGSFPVVGIGASAGGLEAFSALLRHLPLDTGMGFVLVQHLDPEHESALPQLLGRSTSLPVHEVTNKLRVEPNRVYVIPPNTMSWNDSTSLLLRKSMITRALRIVALFINIFAAWFWLVAMSETYTESKEAVLSSSFIVTAVIASVCLVALICGVAATLLAGVASSRLKQYVGLAAVIGAPISLALSVPASAWHYSPAAFVIHPLVVAPIVNLVAGALAFSDRSRRHADIASRG